MTTLVSERLNQQRLALKSGIISHKEKIDLCAQKQLKIKKITEELASKYPVMAKLLENTDAQSKIAASEIEQLAKSQQEVEKVASQSEDQIKTFELLLKDSHPIHLIRALEKDLIVAYQEQNSRYLYLKTQVDKIEKEVENAKKIRLQLSEQLERLKKANNTK